MTNHADKFPAAVPTVADVGLTFPVAVLSLDDAARFADARLVVLVADGPEAGTGVPLTVWPPVHGEAVVAWTVESFANLLFREDMAGDTDELLLNDYPAFLMCGYRVAELVLGEGALVDRGILLKGSPSVDGVVFLSSVDLRLVLRSGHDIQSCGCAHGRMLPFTAVIEDLLPQDGPGAGLATLGGYTLPARLSHLPAASGL